MEINLNDQTRKIVIEDINNQQTSITVLFEYEENGDKYLIGVLEDNETIVGLKQQNDTYVEIPEDEWELVEQVINEFLENNDIYVE